MEVDVEFLKRELPMYFLELCKHQQDIIKCYEEYIEKFIAHQPIKSTFTVDPMARVEVKHITIPEARLVVAMTPACRQEWEYIKTMTPRVSPDYFIEMAYREYMERKNAETD